MAISKIILNGVTQMDVTGKTVTSASMRTGVTALKNDGTDITGSIQDMTLPSVSSSTSSGTAKATITPTSSAQYLNIPTGYNDTAQYYTIAAASGGSSSWTKVAETSYQVSTTSTTATTVETWATGHNEIWTSDKILYIRVRDTAGKRTGYYYGTDIYDLNTMQKNSDTSTEYISISAPTILCVSSNGTYSKNTSTNKYGIYADRIYRDGRIRIQRRYSSSYTLTINGTYKVEVYLLDPPTGAPIFT